jgi:hypothetical protein
MPVRSCLLPEGEGAPQGRMRGARPDAPRPASGLRIEPLRAGRLALESDIRRLTFVVLRFIMASFRAGGVSARRPNHHSPSCGAILVGSPGIEEER